jgi:hypothetical protein
MCQLSNLPPQALAYSIKRRSHQVKNFFVALRTE